MLNNLDLFNMNKIEFKITITFSKIMSLLILFSTVGCSIYFNESAIFMFGIPFVITLITGKQILDKNKKEDNNGNKCE